MILRTRGESNSPTALAVVALLCGVMAAGIGGGAYAQTYTNPLSTPAFPPAGETADGPADPMIVAFEGRYYVMATGNGASYKAMWSDDLVNWSGDQTAFTISSGSPWKWTGLWAPEVERINGRFYLYYTAGSGELQDQHIGVAEGLTPVGPFVDRSYAAPLVSDSSIDAECFVDGDDIYLYYAKGELDPFRLSIWVRKLSGPLTLDPNSTPVLCVDPQEPWEAAVAEGPTVIKRDGKYYLFYSGWGAISANYAVGMAVADHPLGPWVKQPSPFNPIYKRNDAIGLYGPGHGDHVVGPDGLGEWYVHHVKLESDDNWDRALAIDRIVPVGRNQSTERRYTGSGTMTATPSPRLPFDATNFEDLAMPASFTPVAGNWEVKFGKLETSPNAALLIERALSPENRGSFLFDWWVKADNTYEESADSEMEFSFDVERAGQPYRAGFELIPDSDAIRFVETDSAGTTTTLALGQLPLNIDWTAYSRNLRVTKWLDAWTLYLDGSPLLSVEYAADVGWSAWIRACQMPLILDGYRQTVSFLDTFESGTASAGYWTPLTGSWTFDAPTGSDDGKMRQSDDGDAAWKMTLGGSLSLCEFDLSADFYLVNQVTGAGKYPKHGLIHNYVDPQNYAMVFIDDQYDVLATNAIVGGVLQSWVNSPLSMPDTFFVNDYRHLAVTTDAVAGEFVYSLNGVEMLRRSYAGLPACGRAGLITELSQVLVDNFRFSGVAASADVDGDGIAAGSDNCPYDANPLQGDGDGDGVGDACDRCPGSLFGEPTNVLGCRPVATGDADFNGVVDAADVAVFVDCLSGPGGTPTPSGIEYSVEDCLIWFDFDGDLDVDLADYGGLTLPQPVCWGY